MERRWWGKFFFLVFVLALSALYVYPTLTNMDAQKSKFPFKQKITLGLDLQGGLYLVMGVNFNQVFKEMVDRQGTSLQSRFNDKKFQIKNFKIIHDGFPLDDGRISFDVDNAKHDEIYEFLKEEFYSLRLTEDKPDHFQLGLSNEYRANVRENTINQSIEVIRNRIDEFGVSEPSISSQGNDRIIVELPGVKEVDRAKALIGRTAKLEFKIANDKAMGPGAVSELIEKIEKEQGISYKEGDKLSAYVAKINEGAKGKIPADSEISFERHIGPGGESSALIPYLLFSKADVTGTDLQDAQVGINQENGSPVVNFSMNPRGAESFGRLTESHINERLAIVLDGIVHSAPNINSKITDHGQITLGSGQTQDKIMKEAKDLAVVLRAGALPAQLELLEERVVGPSLGADSIKSGAFAGVVGCLAVFLLISIYYKGAGLIAVVSLLMNVLFVLATLVGIEATLTLPGIAGIALTVGIAVDSNVVIYERIREEMVAGKSIRGAIEAGFQKAFRTILDANVTNAAAALVLLAYGTGAVKGFAVTMLIGIVTTLFTAVFVCRLFFDLILSRRERLGVLNKPLSI